MLMSRHIVDTFTREYLFYNRFLFVESSTCDPKLEIYLITSSSQFFLFWLRF